MRIKCPYCDARLKVPAEARKVRCVRCQNAFMVDESGTPLAQGTDTVEAVEYTEGKEEDLSSLEVVRELFSAKYEVLELLGHGGMGKPKKQPLVR